MDDVREVVGADVDWDSDQSNPGRCWVSTHCIDFSAAAASIIELLKSLSASLTVHYNTVVKDTEVDTQGRITQLTAPGPEQLALLDQLPQFWRQGRPCDVTHF